MKCKRCGTAVGSDGFCDDVTCPFSDHKQACKAGWNGHPERAPHPQDDDRPLPCTCTMTKRKFYRGHR